MTGIIGREAVYSGQPIEWDAALRVRSAAGAAKARVRPLSGGRSCHAWPISFSLTRVSACTLLPSPALSSVSHPDVVFRVASCAAVPETGSIALLLAVHRSENHKVQCVGEQCGIWQKERCKTAAAKEGLKN